MTDSGTSGGKQGLSAARRLGRNVIFSGATSLADTLLLLLLILAGRLLGLEAFGIFSLGLAVSALLVFVTNLGLDSLAVRQLAVDKDNAAHLIGSVLAWKITISLISLSIYGLVIAYMIEDETIRYVAYILGPAAIFRSFNMTFRSIFQGFERFSTEMRIVLLERVLLLSFGLIVLLFSADPISFSLVFLFSRALSFLVYLVVIQSKVCRFSLTIDAAFIKQFQLTAWPLGVSTVIFGLYMQLDILVLGLFVNVGEVGLFSSAMKIYEGALVIPLVFNSVFYPRLSYAYEHERRLFHELAPRLIKYVLILSVFLALSGLFFSSEIIMLLFGEDYLPASTVLSILLAAVAIQFMVTVLYTFLRSIGALKSVMHLMFLGLIVKLAGDLLFIPSFEIKGAAMAACASVAVMLIAALYRLRKIIVWSESYYVMLSRVTASTIITIVLHMVLPQLSASLSPFILGFVFLSLLLALGVFDRQELALVRSLFPGRVPK